MMPRLKRVINTPTRGIGDRTLDVLRNLTRERQITLWASRASGHTRKYANGTCFNRIASFPRVD